MIEELNTLYAQTTESLMHVREQAIQARKVAENENRGTDARNLDQIVSKTNRAHIEMLDTIASILRDVKAVQGVK